MLLASNQVWNLPLKSGEEKNFCILKTWPLTKKVYLIIILYKFQPKILPQFDIDQYKFIFFPYLT